jgi:hypothetical protein
MSFGPRAHVILFETAHPFTNGGFDLSVGFHGNSSLSFQ